MTNHKEQQKSRFNDSAIGKGRTMSVARIRQAIRLWKTPGVPKASQRHNQRQWLRMIELLGDRWLLAKQMPRKG